MHALIKRETGRLNLPLRFSRVWVLKLYNFVRTHFALKLDLAYKENVLHPRMFMNSVFSIMLPECTNKIHLDEALILKNNTYVFIMIMEK